MLLNLSLLTQGFSPHQAHRLTLLKLHYDSGAFRELTDADKRLLFARWLVEHGRVGEGEGPRDAKTGRAEIAGRLE